MVFKLGDLARCPNGCPLEDLGVEHSGWGEDRTAHIVCDECGYEGPRVAHPGEDLEFSAEIKRTAGLAWNEVLKQSADP